MTKIQNLSSQQRLRQLAKSQLGHEFIQSAATQGHESVAAKQEPIAISNHSQLRHLASHVMASNEQSSAVLQRAMRRQELQLQRQQLNLEKVLMLTQDMLPDQHSREEVDSDWFEQFCQLVQDISAAPMQKLWAKILAHEIQQPGRFSFKTLNILRQMHYRDAQALQLAASMASRLNGQQPEQIFFGYSMQASVWRWLQGKHKGVLNLSQHQLTYPDILSLVDLGILHQTEIETGTLNRQQELLFMTTQYARQGRVLQAGLVLHYYKFTLSGSELLSLLNVQPEAQYWAALTSLLQDVIEFPA